MNKENKKKDKELKAVDGPLGGAVTPETTGSGLPGPVLGSFGFGLPRRASVIVLSFHRIKVMTAQGLHLFPSRTEKLNLATPMVLRKRESR